MHARAGVPLAPLTTLRVGGPAARMVDLDREEYLLEALADAESQGQRVFVLGSGSNVVAVRWLSASLLTSATQLKSASSFLDRVCRSVRGPRDHRPLLWRISYSGT